MQSAFVRVNITSFEPDAFAESTASSILPYNEEAFARLKEYRTSDAEITEPSENLYAESRTTVRVVPEFLYDAAIEGDAV